jgi:hypothetical protein
MSQHETYLGAKRYEALVSALSEAATRPDPFTGRVGDPDQIKVVLGEFGAIWPESIGDDLASNDRAHRARMVARLVYRAQMVAGAEELLAELDRM